MIGLAITEDASLRSFAGILSSPVALDDFTLLLWQLSECLLEKKPSLFHLRGETHNSALSQASDYRKTISSQSVSLEHYR